jgi:predicted kinase
MDKVTLSNPLVIIVTGLPGAGKSFFATQFSDSFGSALISEDKIRWTLFANHTHDKNENIVVKQIVDMMLLELFKTKKTFVVDGDEYSNRASRSTLIAKAKKAGYGTITVVVQTDTLTAKQRSLHRNTKKLRDAYKQSISSDVFEAQSKKYQAPLSTDKTKVVISGKHTYPTQARIVLKKILEVQNINQTEQPTKQIVRPRRGPFVQ